MIAVQTAQDILFAHISLLRGKPPSIKKLYPIHKVLGKILQEDIYADRDWPPFPRVTMDGIALQFNQWQKGQRNFSIEKIHKAGDPPPTLQNPASCIEVMTGASLPLGTDCVIRYEDLDIEPLRDLAKIKDHILPQQNQIRENQNIHFQGADQKAGDLVLRKGTKLLSPQIGVLASAGKEAVLVAESPSIALITTGDELVPIHQTPLPHQIRVSNSYVLAAELASHGFDQITHFHFRDDRQEILQSLWEILPLHTYFIFTGGVSMGKYDYLPEIFETMKIQKKFHQIRQRPGKPFWFGTHNSSSEEKLFFGLPGNPASCLTCLRRYIIPALRLSLGDPFAPPYALLENDFAFAPPLTYFLPVKANYTHLKEENKTQIWVEPILTQGSGDFSALAKSDGFIELEETKNIFKKGEAYPFYPWGA